MDQKPLITVITVTRMTMSLVENCYLRPLHADRAMSQALLPAPKKENEALYWSATLSVRDATLSFWNWQSQNTKEYAQ